MLELRPNCECCDRDFPPDSLAARTWSFECTFCVACVEGALGGMCPNCGGEFLRRPIYPAEKFACALATTTQALKRGGCTALVLWLALVLGGCNGGTGTLPVTGGGAVQDGIAGNFEIIYRGASTRFQADDRACPSPGLVAIRPENDVFTYRLGGRVLIETTIIGDGTLSGQGQNYTLTGTASADKIEGDVTNGRCGYHFRAFRKRES